VGEEGERGREEEEKGRDLAREKKGGKTWGDGAGFDL